MFANMLLTDGSHGSGVNRDGHGNVKDTRMASWLQQTFTAAVTPNLASNVIMVIGLFYVLSLDITVHIWLKRHFS